MLANAGRLPEAKRYYQAVLALRPDNPFALNSIAFILAENGGDLEEALRLIQRAMQKAPGHPAISDTLGWIYLKKGMNDSAMQTFNNLVRLQPQNPEFRYHLAMALLEKGDKQQAKIQLQNALTSRPAPEMEKKIRTLARTVG